MTNLFKTCFICRIIFTNRKRYLIFVLFCFFFLTGYPQGPSLQIKYFSRKDGIFSSYINHVTQDSTGYIWIGSQYGLYRYDGYDIKGYFSKEGDSCSLPGDNINYIYCDHSGTLWIATTHGLCRYNEDLDNFIRSPDFFPQPGLTEMNINQVGEDTEGNLLISCFQSIFRSADRGKKFSPVVSLDTKQINYFLADSTGNLWIGCSDNLGLLRYNMNTGKKDGILVPGSGKNNLNNGTVSKFAMDHGKLWIATLGGGINTFDINTGKLKQFPYNNRDEAMAINTLIDREKNVWTVDYTGLKIFDKQTEIFIGYYPRPDDPLSIRGAVRGIFQDKQGNYWVYNAPGGVGICIKKKGFSHFGDNTGEFWHTSGSSIVSIQEDTRGNLWLGSGTGGIDVFKWQKGTTTRFKPDEKDKYSVGRGSIMCLFRDREGIMWIGSYFGGLQYYDETSGKFVSFTNKPDDPNSIAGNDVRSIAEDSDGNLWLAIHGKGVDKFDKKLNQFFHYNNAINKLSNDWTFKVLINHQGDLWVATAWGLSRLKKGETFFNSYINQSDDTTSLTNNKVNVIYEDNNHILWAGTQSGLNRFNAGKNNFTQYSKIFKSNYITGILSDQENHIWVSHLLGISMLDDSLREVKEFSSVDGLGSDEYIACSFYKNDYNELFFGGIKGVDIFNPRKLILNNQPPVVIIDKIEILNKELIIGSPDQKLKKQISRTNQIILSYTDNMITLSFKALNFINPQLNQYAYKLEGFEKNWNNNKSFREATYTNLNPGNYVFKVVASNNDGVWATKGAELKIKILPPWYKTLAFRIFSVFCVIVIILGYITIRTSNLEKQKFLLEKTVSEKTSELSEKNILLKNQTEHLNEVNQLLIDRQNQLEQQSEELIIQSESLVAANKELHKLNSTKDKLFSIIAHDLKNPFNAIIGFSELLEDDFETLGEKEKYSYIKTIHASSQKVFALLQNLLLWSRSQIKRINYNPIEFQIRGVLEDVVELNKESLKNKDINIKTDCPAEVKVWADLELVKTILRNLVSNAIKFTPQNGIIRLNVLSENEEVSISVCDNGVGLSKKKIDELLYADIIDPEVGTKGEKGSGLGISLCRDFIKMNKGQLHISGEEGKGTCITFSLPVARD